MTYREAEEKLNSLDTVEFLAMGNEYIAVIVPALPKEKVRFIKAFLLDSTVNAKKFSTNFEYKVIGVSKRYGIDGTVRQIFDL